VRVYVRTYVCVRLCACRAFIYVSLIYNIPAILCVELPKRCHCFKVDLLSAATRHG